MMPILICNRISDVNVRLGIMFTSTSVFLMLLSFFTRGKVVELTVAAAT